MTFTPLAMNPAARPRAELPQYGVRIGVSGRKQDGPRPLAGYTRIAIGRHLATTLGLVRTEQSVAVLAGEHKDAGKLAIRADDASKFMAKKQPDGSYFVALGYHATRVIFAPHFATFTIENVDVLDKMAIMTVPDAARVEQASG